MSLTSKLLPLLGALLRASLPAPAPVPLQCVPVRVRARPRRVRRDYRI